MSATFKNAKKKLVQTEFRRLINEHKGKVQNVKKIESPLAKYNDLGQLTCILCKSIVKSENVWAVHINSKQHRENVEAAKKLKEKTKNFTSAPKRPLTPPQIVEEAPQKKLKGILKNSSTKSDLDSDLIKDQSDLSKDFFDSSSKSGPPILPVQKAGVEKMEVDEDPTEVLPEGFFDDPKQDAKARNQEYKDPVEEEWERFQKEIREADNKSAAIIAEDQEEATNERQIDEIEEQMKKLSKVLDLEKKKENLISVVNNTKVTDSAEALNEDDNEEDFNEYLDWRSKKVFK